MAKLVNIHDSRYHLLEWEFQKEYFQTIIHFLKEEKINWKIIYPKWSDIFRAFELTHREDVSVVILWQDPYHGPNQAHGLCFSVPEWTTPPPSLINIYKEIHNEYPEKIVNSSSWDLSNRATQWALLLNAFLTVESWKPLSHSTIGREIFTDHIITSLSEKKEWIVFMLWWSFAKSKAKLIDNQKHLILTANHPSPLSANRWWWFGNNHFLSANEYLEKQWKKAINR